MVVGVGGVIGVTGVVGAVVCGGVDHGVVVLNQPPPLPPQIVETVTVTV